MSNPGLQFSGNRVIYDGLAGADNIFGDGSEVRHALEEANQVYRLYQATFNRAPDGAGHEGWTQALFSGLSTLAHVREGFVGSQEFKNIYAGVDDATFVKQMYINVLDRDFDNGGVTQAEVDGWTDQLSASCTRADIVRGFVQPVQFRNNTADDLTESMRGHGLDDVINGGAGDNVLAGGMFSDRFVFVQSDGANNNVLDLEAWDELSFVGFGYTSDAQARAKMTQSGNAVAFADQDVQVTLEHVRLSDITDDMILI